MRVLFAAAALVFGMVGLAQAQEAYVPGVHYQVIAKPVATNNPDMVEVKEVFWYGCSHCFKFEPMVQQWKKSLPEGAEFLAMPAVWNNNMSLHAKMFYTAEALGKLDDMHQAMFNAMNIERKRLASEGEIKSLFTTFGVSEEEFKSKFNSFQVDSKVRDSQVKARAYGIQGTPELIVDGRYRVSASMAGSQENMLTIARFLVDKALMQKSKP